MKNKWITAGILAALACITFSGCKKKEVQEGPVEEVMTAISLTDLETGHFYVKSGDSFYLLPMENQTFDITKEILSTDNSVNGMVENDLNRLVSFVYKDTAIPTLYKNDQLIYVSDGSISSFTWERFLDYGYSIGFSSLQLSDAEKIKSSEKTIAAFGSTVEAMTASLKVPEGSDITVDKINGTILTSQYLNDGGIITGMSRDATANIDLYIGTQHVPVTVKADTKYYKSFELYKTEKYSLSTDGYAIIEIPSYLKSGYYMLNNSGFVKFLNVDRGVDESGIDLTTPYYYIGEEGKILTFYEWQEENGMLPSGSLATQQGNIESLNVEDFPEREKITIDHTQSSMDVMIAYKYIDDEARLDASKNGRFPKVYLFDPTGKAVPILEDESRTYGAGNNEKYIYLSTAVDGMIAGEWYLLYSNFEDITKAVEMDIHSGNATSYLHHSSSGTIDIYYEDSQQAHDLTITWEQADRAAKEIKITAPDGIVYSKKTTPGNIMADEYGKYVVKLPELIAGTYHFEIKGDKLGRVWVNCGESVGFTQEAVLKPAEESSSESAETKASYETAISSQ